MTEFLLREKEFLKLNQEIDLKTQAVLTKNINGNVKNVPKYRSERVAEREESVELSFVMPISAVAVNEPLDMKKSKKFRTKKDSFNRGTLRKGPAYMDENNSDQKESDKNSPKLAAKQCSWQQKANTLPKGCKDPLPGVMRRQTKNSDSKQKSRLGCVQETVESGKRSPNAEHFHSAAEPIPDKAESSKKTCPLIETYRNANFKGSSSSEEILAEESVNSKVKRKSPSPHNKIGDTKTSNRFSNYFPVKKCNRPPASVIEKIPKKNLSSDGLIKFLKAKVTILQEELEKSSIELHQKVEEIENYVDCQKKLELQRDQVICKNNTLTCQVSRMEEKLTEVERKLKDRETENVTANREMESLKREIRILNQNNMNLQKRLYRNNEELEAARKNLDRVRENDREFKDHLRMEQESHEKQIKNMKKQKNELLSAYKKQLYLLDNLKRRNTCLEQAKLISFAEKEFNKILEWNNKN